MRRHTSFAIDLALLAGTKPCHDQDRSLSWADFTEHWEQALPSRRHAYWSTRTHRLAWCKVADAPKEWSETLWPDFHHPIAQGSRKLDSIPEGAHHDLETGDHYFPVTVMHMALRDAVKDPRAQEAFRFLAMAGVSPNLWPGHGSSVLSQACLTLNLHAMATLWEAGNDFQNTLPPDRPSRASFAGSSLLHRVGPGLAKLYHLSRQNPGRDGVRQKKVISVLRFLVDHVPDPEAVDAQGHTPLSRLAVASLKLAGLVEPWLAERRARTLARQLGLTRGDDLHEGWAESDRRWACEGSLRVGAVPRLFVPDPVAGETEAWPRRFRALPAGETAPDMHIARAHVPSIAPPGVAGDPGSVLAHASEQGADAVAIGPSGPKRRWWFFSPHQVRPAWSWAPPSPVLTPRARF